MEQSVVDRESLDFKDELAATASVVASGDAFRRLIARHGFDAFACGDYDALDLQGSRYFAVSWPRNFSRFYYGDQELNPDPLRTVIPWVETPVSWSDLLSTTKFERAMQRSIEITSEFKWREGFVMPQGPKGARRAMVSLKGARGAISPAERDVLTTAATAFYKRVRSFEPLSLWPSQPAQLTDREAECLGLVALGMNDEAIGAQLGVSRATAHKHVENSKRKLGAFNRAHAVAISFRRGLIAL